MTAAIQPRTSMSVSILLKYQSDLLILRGQSRPPPLHEGTGQAGTGRATTSAPRLERELSRR